MLKQETVDVQTLPSRIEAQEAAAAASQEDFTPPVVDTPGPALTKEDVAGKTAEAEGSPDRELVAPSIREFLRAQQEPTPPSGLEKEVADLRGALDGLANRGQQEEALTTEQTILAKLEALESRDVEAREANEAARAEEEYNNRVRAMREGVIANVDARKEDFPGLIALEQQEVVFNALVSRSQEGLETSEDEIASEVEEGLRTVYNTLHAVYGSATPSEDSKPSSERKVTLTPGLAGADEAADVENMSRSERIEYLWAKTQKQD